MEKNHFLTENGWSPEQLPEWLKERNFLCFTRVGRSQGQLRGEIRSRVEDDQVDGGEAALDARPPQVQGQRGEEEAVEALPEEVEEHRGPRTDPEEGRAHQQHDEAAAGARCLPWGGEGGVGQAV